MRYFTDNTLVLSEEVEQMLEDLKAVVLSEASAIDYVNANNSAEIVDALMTYFNFVKSKLLQGAIVNLDASIINIFSWLVFDPELESVLEKNIINELAREFKLMIDYYQCVLESTRLVQNIITKPISRIKKTLASKFDLLMLESDVADKEYQLDEIFMLRFLSGFQDELRSGSLSKKQRERYFWFFQHQKESFEQNRLLGLCERNQMMLKLNAVLVMLNDPINDDETSDTLSVEEQTLLNVSPKKCRIGYFLPLDWQHKSQPQH